MNDSSVNFIRKIHEKDNPKHKGSEGKWLYSYENVDYVNANKKVIITCLVHGDFLQSPKSHLSGSGCPDCHGNQRISTETFIDRAIVVHKGLYDYENTNYKNMKTKVDINCKVHGAFSQNPNDHLSGKGCPSCSGGTKRTTSTFIFNCKKIHKDTYLYHNTVYESSHSKVTITCKIHGDFEQLATNHLSGYGCPECGGKVRLTTEDFIKRSLELHNEIYSYENVKYKNRKTKIDITCKIHGDFRQKPNDHLSGQGCPACSGNINLTTKDFIERCITLHGDLYDYSDVEYINNSTKVVIKCSIHGAFEQIPASHFIGYGCPSCANITKGWTKTAFNNHCIRNNNGYGILYVVRCFNDEESFYKIGITSQSISKRYPDKNKMPYNMEEIYSLELVPETAFDLERQLLRDLAEYRYKPRIHFEGTTECFSAIELIDNQLRLIEQDV